MSGPRFLDCFVIFPLLWFWSVDVLLFDFERGGSRRGLAGGELQGCMPWAVSSPCQRTGEMLLRGE